jgi:hypothetical protein
MITQAIGVNPRLQTKAIAAMVTAAYASGVCAEQADTPDFSFNGFGTLGLVHSSEKQADFTSIFSKPDGAGHSDDWSADVDSLLGVQVTANLSSQLVAVVQVIAEENYDHTYRPHVEWANIKYEFTPDFSARVGRTVLPTALLSDTRNVGYTYAWVRPPQETYRLVPLTNSDGVDVSYRLRSGQLTNTVQLGVGRHDADLPNNGGTLETRDLRVISNTAEFGSFTVHVAYLRARATLLELDRALFDVFRQFGPQGAAIAQKHSLNDTTVSAISFGANYDPGQWFVTGEWSRLESRSFIGGTAWHASGGYRFGQLMPYVTYAQALGGNLSDPGLDVSTLPPLLAEPALALNAALNSILSMNSVQTTVSLGGRWDFMTNGSFKLQFDHIRMGAGSSGVLTNTQPGFQLGGQVNILSATFDFVF